MDITKPDAIESRRAAWQAIERIFDARLGGESEFLMARAMKAIALALLYAGDQIAKKKS